MNSPVLFTKSKRKIFKQPQLFKVNHCPNANYHRVTSKPRSAKHNHQQQQQQSNQNSSSSTELNRWGILGIFDRKQMETFHIHLLGHARSGKKTIASRFSGMHYMLKRGHYRFVKINQERIVEVDLAHLLDTNNSYTVSQLGTYLEPGHVDAVILCFRLDDRDSFEALEDIIHTISSEHYIVALCGTRADINVNHREVNFSEAKKFCERIPNCIGYFETCVVLNGMPQTPRSPESDEEDILTDVEETTAGVDHLLYQVIKEIFLRRYKEPKFNLLYMTNTGDEYEPYIPELEQFIDTFSTAADSTHDMSHVHESSSKQLLSVDEQTDLSDHKTSSRFDILSFCNCFGNITHMFSNS